MNPSSLRRTLVLLPFLAAALPALAADVTEDRPVGAFRAIAARGSFDVLIRQATKPSVQLRGDATRVAKVETRVVDRGGVPTLEVDSKSGAGGVSLVVDVVELESIALAGSTDATVEALKTGRLSLAVSGAGDVKFRQLAAAELGVKVSGSGDVHANGRVERLRVAIAGSGNVDTRGLAADEVTVSVAGSGDATVNAQKALKVSIAGSGDVSYTGEPSLTTSIAGSGSVTKTR